MSGLACAAIPVSGICIIALNPVNQGVYPIKKRHALLLLRYLMRLLHFCTGSEIA